MEIPKTAVSRLTSCVTDIGSRLNVHSALAFAGMAGPLVLVFCDITAAAGADGYSFIGDSISSLALTRIGYVLVIGFMAIGLLVEVFVAGLLYNIRHSRWFHLGIGMLVFFGFFLLLIGAFRTDPVDAPDTAEGIIHGLAALGAFWLFPLALLALSPSIKRDPDWSNLFRYTIVTCILALLLALATAIFKDRITWFGLMERLLVLNMIAWVEIAAFRMLCLSLRRPMSGQMQIEGQGRIL